jgi:spore coat polysaccharide biosynthesis protein SpsF
MSRRLVAALACRNSGSRLYGKPVQNLDIHEGYRIIDYIIDSLKSIKCIDQIILAISEGIENKIFIKIAKEKNIEYIIGEEIDVLNRLILSGEKGNATDIFRITTESPFLYFNSVESLWIDHCEKEMDATFLDEIVDGCGFEIIKLDSLKLSHKKGNVQHRSELCSLYIRENKDDFKINQVTAPSELFRKDLRLTVDNPEDLVLCRAIYKEFKELAPCIPLEKIIIFLDMNLNLIQLTLPFTEEGYKTMYL